MDCNINTKQKTTQNKENSGLPSLTMQRTDTDMKTALQSHEQIINSLAEFIKGKMNVHGEIRKLTASLGSSFKRLSLMLEKTSLETQRPATRVAETQTTDLSLNSRANIPESTIKAVETHDHTPKRVQIRKVKRKERSSPEEVNTVMKKSKNDIGPQEMPVGEEIKSIQQVSEWQDVSKKKSNKKKKGVRSNAVLIRPNEKEKYADILKRVKQDTAADNVGQYVDKIRRTASGDMLIVLTKSNNDKTAEVKKTITDILGSEAVVVSKVPEVTIEIKDLDETTTKEEIVKALQKVDNDDKNITLDAIKSVRQAYGGTQTATIKVDEKTASKIIGENGKIKIGWVNCRVRKIEKPVKCYKCWRFGHFAGKCTSTIDRSNLCVKCGNTGHKINDCKKDPLCALCTEDGKKDCAHISGCGKCPVFRAALQTVRKKPQW